MTKRKRKVQRRIADVGQLIVGGLTLPERLRLGLDEIIPIEFFDEGKILTTDVVRRRFTHPLDRYLVTGKLGQGEPAAYRLTAGMRLHDTFQVAAGEVRVTRTYEHFTSAGRGDPSPHQMAARATLNTLWRGKKHRAGGWIRRPVLNEMASRVTLHVCAQGRGTQEFDAALAVEIGAYWRAGMAMAVLVSSLDRLIEFYTRPVSQARRSSRVYTPGP